MKYRLPASAKSISAASSTDCVVYDITTTTAALFVCSRERERERESRNGFIDKKDERDGEKAEAVALGRMSYNGGFADKRLFLQRDFHLYHFIPFCTGIQLECVYLSFSDSSRCTNFVLYMLRRASNLARVSRFFFFTVTRAHLSRAISSFDKAPRIFLFF